MGLLRVFSGCRILSCWSEIRAGSFLEDLAGIKNGPLVTRASSPCWRGSTARTSESRDLKRDSSQHGLEAHVTRQPLEQLARVTHLPPRFPPGRARLPSPSPPPPAPSASGSTGETIRAAAQWAPTPCGLWPRSFARSLPACAAVAPPAPACRP